MKSYKSRKIWKYWSPKSRYFLLYCLLYTPLVSEMKPGSMRTNEGRHRWDFTLLFGWLLILALLELGFTVDTFQYLERKHQWISKVERRRICFLLFSAIRSVLLSTVYIGFHWANKFFSSLHHTVFLVLNTVFWIVGGVLVKQNLGIIECGGVGRLNGGLSECHELKIIEILSWITAASSIVICVYVVIGAIRKQKRKAERGQTAPQRRGWFERLGFKRSRKSGITHSSGPMGLMSEKQYPLGQV